MTIVLSVNAESAAELRMQLRGILGPDTAQPEVSTDVPASTRETVAAEEAQTAEEVTPPKKRGPKPKAPPQTIEGTATDVTSPTEAPEPKAAEAPAADAPKFTIDEAREKMKQFAKDGHMDQVAEALTFFGARKISEIDPDCKGDATAKIGAFIAKIEELVSKKVV